ncbi:MAG: electron transfer flavoprotein subunit beta/FixA family protein [Bacillota bacterium]
MDIELIVLVKQVPLTGEVEVDPETGNLIREGIESQTNPFDLHAIEAALYLRERFGGRVTALSMGPPQAEATVRETFSMGVDRGILLSDPAFAGADTLATAFTLARAIELVPHDLVVAGMQTTDGDTAQVGPGVAEFLGIPHASYVKEIGEIEDGERIAVSVDRGEEEHRVQLHLPALVTVTREVNQPRLPSFRLRLQTADRPVEIWNREELTRDPDADGEDYFGLDGSPTWVERIFPPPGNPKRETWRGDSRELAGRLLDRLEEWRYL